FYFVPKSQVLEVAQKEGAIAFDTPGADLHHQEDLCTFDVIIRQYGLTDEALPEIPVHFSSSLVIAIY
ncbi:MAG: chromate resistance protein, partial [Desulfobacteraceae bacterium]|nr:chromate resistance protein [Desulfobacteraceae bacterium]